MVRTKDKVKTGKSSQLNVVQTSELNLADCHTGLQLISPRQCSAPVFFLGGGRGDQYPCNGKAIRALLGSYRDLQR